MNMVEPGERYFCENDCKAVEPERPRDTGCGLFGRCDTPEVMTANPSDVRTQTGCERYGAELTGTCTEVVGEGQMPSCHSWSCEEVGQWIVSVGFPLYRDCFERNSISGHRLISVDASALPRMGITDFEHIKIIAKMIRDLLHIEEIPWNRSISLPPREERGMYLECKCVTGPEADKLQYDQFHDDFAHLKFAPPLCNLGLLTALEAPNCGAQ